MIEVNDGDSNHAFNEGEAISDAGLRLAELEPHSWSLKAVGEFVIEPIKTSFLGEDLIQEPLKVLDDVSPLKALFDFFSFISLDA